MNNFKIGDKVKDITHEKSPIITVIGVFPDNYIHGSFIINGIEDFGYWKFADLTLYKSSGCLEILELMDSEECAGDYCKALKKVLDKHPGIDRDELEKELDQFFNPQKTNKSHEKTNIQAINRSNCRK
jgi:hypothetical protein